MFEKPVKDFVSMVTLRNSFQAAIGYVYAAIGLCFTWVQIQDLSATEVVNYPNYSDVLKIIIVLMYLSWSFGIGLDVAMAKIYVADPDEGKISLVGYSHIASFGVSAVILIYVRDNVYHFVLALILFSIVSLVSLIHSAPRLRRIVDRSRVFYVEQDKHAKLLMLDEMAAYNLGIWSWVRQAVLWAILGLIVVACYGKSLSSRLVAILLYSFPEMRRDALIQFIPIASVILFLLVAEGSQWFMRLSTYFSIRMLRDITKRYEIKPIINK